MCVCVYVKVMLGFLYAMESVSTPVPGKFWGLYIVGQDPSGSKSNRLHVDIIFRFCCHSFEVYSSIDSPKVMGDSPKVSNFHRFIGNQPPVLPEH